MTRLLDPEYEGTMILQSVGNPRRLEFSAIPLWEPKTSQTGTKRDRVSTRQVMRVYT